MIVEFYENNKGIQPAKEFLLSLSVKDKAKMIAVINQLVEKGNLLRRPYSAALKNNILELRVKGEDNQLRILYFFLTGNKAILSHGFIKKTRKIPDREIMRAVENRNDYERRQSNE